MIKMIAVALGMAGMTMSSANALSEVSTEGDADDTALDCQSAEAAECSQCACLLSGSCTAEATTFCIANIEGCSKYLACQGAEDILDGGADGLGDLLGGLLGGLVGELVGDSSGSGSGNDDEHASCPNPMCESPEAQQCEQECLPCLLNPEGQGSGACDECAACAAYLPCANDENPCNSAQGEACVSNCIPCATAFAAFDSGVATEEDWLAATAVDGGNCGVVCATCGPYIPCIGVETEDCGDHDDHDHDHDHMDGEVVGQLAQLSLHVETGGAHSVGGALLSDIQQTWNNCHGDVEGELLLDFKSFMASDAFVACLTAGEVNVAALNTVYNDYTQDFDKSAAGVVVASASVLAVIVALAF